MRVAKDSVRCRAWIARNRHMWGKKTPGEVVWPQCARRRAPDTDLCTQHERIDRTRGVGRVGNVK